jgi:hypothetical protein
LRTKPLRVVYLERPAEHPTRGPFQNSPFTHTQCANIEGPNANDNKTTKHEDKTRRKTTKFIIIAHERSETNKQNMRMGRKTIKIAVFPCKTEMKGEFEIPIECFSKQ